MTNHFIDLLYFVVLVFGPIPLAFSIVALLSDKKQSPFPLRHIVLAAIVLWVGLQIFVGLLLGTAGALNRSALLLAEVFLLSGGMILYRWKKLDWPVGSLISGMQATTWPEKLGLWLIGMLAFELWTRVSRAPIADFDSLYYHLPMAAAWFQSGSLSRLDGFGQISMYPYHWEMLSALFLFPFHSDFQIAFPNVLVLLIWPAAIFALAREVNASRLASLLMAGFATLLPINIAQLNSLHVDLAFAAFFIAGLYFLIHYLRTHEPSSLFLILLSAGIFAGIKMSAAGFILVLGMAALFWLLTKNFHLHRINQNPRFIPALLIGLAAVAFLSGYWYFINTIETGNPLGYMDVKFGPITIFHGRQGLGDYLNLIYPHFSELKALIKTLYGAPADFNELVKLTTLAHLFDFISRSDWRTFIKQLWAQGGVPLILIVAGMVLSFARLRKNGADRNIQVGLVGILCITLVLYWITPYSGGSPAGTITDWIGQAFRYAYPAAGILAVLAALGITPFPWLSYVLFLPFSYLALKIIILDAGQGLAAALLLALVAMGLCTGWFLATRSRRTVLRLLPVFAALLVIVWIMPLLNQDRRAGQAGLFGGINTYLQENTQPGEAVGYIMSFFSYPLYSSTLDRRVIFSPAYTNREADWLAQLEQRQIQVVALGPFREPGWKETLEYQWLEDANGPFIKVFGNDPANEIVLYRLRR